MNNFSEAQSSQRVSEHQPRNPPAASKKRSGFSNPGVPLPQRAGVAWDLLDGISDTVILINSQGIILWVNNTASDQLDAPRDALITTSIWDVYPPRKVDQLKMLINDVVKIDRPLNIIEKDGGRWVDVSVFPLNDTNGELKEIAIHARDITAQIEAEEALKRISLQLINVEEDERHRISRDLHDEIGQEMAALLIGLRSIQNSVEKNQSLVVDQISGAIRNLEAIMKRLRQVFYQLYPPSLHNTVIKKVLNAHCSSFARSAGIKVDFSCPEDFPAISKVYEVTLYRFMQVGLANAVKHGKANSVWVNLDATGDEINISVEDNGLGFDPDKVILGLGLHGIQERLLMLKGSFEIEAAPGKGTKLFGSLPKNFNET